MSDLIRREDAVSRVSDLLMFELQGKRLPTWNEVYRAINDIPSAEPERIIKIGQRSGKTLESAIYYLQNTGWLQEHDRILTKSAVQKQKKGRWERRKGSDCWECSQCHAVLENDDLGMHNFYFCYHCGANMMNKSGYMDIEEVSDEL